MTRARIGFFLLAIVSAAACSPGGGVTSRASPFAPPHDPRGAQVDQLLVGHRLMAAGEYELALEAFNRAAAQDGLTAEVLLSMGSANLGLGRLNQAEKLLRTAAEKEDGWPEIWNNLAVVLMERGKVVEAAEIFKRAYALDNGESDAIRDNLRLALEKIDNADYDGSQQQYKLVRRGSGDYLIRTSG